MDPGLGSGGNVYDNRRDGRRRAACRLGMARRSDILGCIQSVCLVRRRRARSPGFGVACALQRRLPGERTRRPHLFLCPAFPVGRARPTAISRRQNVRRRRRSGLDQPAPPRHFRRIVRRRPPGGLRNERKRPLFLRILRRRRQPHAQRPVDQAHAVHIHRSGGIGNAQSKRSWRGALFARCRSAGAARGPDAVFRARMASPARLCKRRNHR